MELKFPGRIIKRPLIVGGVDATASQAPWQVSFGFTDGIYAYHFCGGSIISNKVVLTAAHCCDAVSVLPISYLLVLYDGTYIPNLKYINFLTGYTMHPQYDKDTIVNDVCILNVQDDFKFSTTVQKIDLATADPSDGVTASLTGWGQTDGNDDTSLTGRLQYTTLDMISRDVCLEKWTALSPGAVINEGNVCAGRDGTSGCMGDSGGPLVVNRQLVGVVSWGSAKCIPSKDIPNVFASVAHFHDWINDPPITTSSTASPLPSSWSSISTPSPEGGNGATKVTGITFFTTGLVILFSLYNRA